jgi:FtsZ-interacting cell division protein ZipA
MDNLTINDAKPTKIIQPKPQKKTAKKKKQLQPISAENDSENGNSPSQNGNFPSQNGQKSSNSAENIENIAKNAQKRAEKGAKSAKKREKRAKKQQREEFCAIFFSVFLHKTYQLLKFTLFRCN